MQDAHMRRSIMHHILATDEVSNVESAEDATRLVNKFIETNLTFRTPDKSQEFSTDILDGIMFVLMSKDPNEAFKNLGDRIVKYSRPQQKTGKRILLALDNSIVVRVPQIEEENTGLRDNLVFVLTFILEMLGYEKEQLTIIVDPGLGKSVNLLARLRNSMEVMRASKNLPAYNAGEAINLNEGFKENLLELLAAIRVARRNSGLTRTAASGKTAKSTRVTPELLRKTINNRVGMNDSGSDPWVCNILRGVFSEMTRPSFMRFPGEWMHSLRQRNEASSDAGIMAKMGFVAIQVAPSKLKFVVCSKVHTEKVIVQNKARNGNIIIGKGQEMDKTSIITLGKHENFQETNFLEFRTLVTGLLPYIDPTSSDKIKDQIPSDSYRPKSSSTLEFFNKHREFVDDCNLAFAVKSSIKNKNSKSDEHQFAGVRNRLLNSTAHIGFIDSKGTIYSSYSAIPENVRKWFESEYHRKIWDTQEQRQKFVDSVRLEQSSSKMTLEGPVVRDWETLEISKPVEKQAVEEPMEDIAPEAQTTDESESASSVPDPPSKRGRGGKQPRGSARGRNNKRK